MTVSIIIVYSSSKVAKVNSGRIATLECKNYVLLMPNTQPNTLIVIDNASCHSRRLEAVPTKNTRKGEMHLITYSFKNVLISLKDLTYEGYRRVGPKQRRNKIYCIEKKVSL